MTANETQVHHYEPKTNHQSMEYHHKVSPAQKKKSKPRLWQENSWLQFFWDADGVIHVDFLEPGTTTNPECYIATFKTSKQRLRRNVWKYKRNILLQHDNTRPDTS
jgi:hypothetical protein